MINDSYLAFSIYFLFLIIIGTISSKKDLSQSEFVMGNRSLGYWVTALTAHASDMSAWLFMAFPMTIMIHGLSSAWIGLGLILGMMLNWLIVAKKIRIETEKTNTYTLSSFFEKKFNDRSGKLKILSAFFSLVFMVHYLSAGLIALGYLFEQLFEINYVTGVWIATIGVLAYTSFGGYLTVATVDLVQGIFLLIMIIIVPIAAFKNLDLPLIASIEKLNANDKLQFFPNSFEQLRDYIYLAASWGLGYFGMPHIITKFMGIKDANEIKKSMTVGMIWQTLALAASGLVGLVGYLYFADGIENPEMIFVSLCNAIFFPTSAAFVLCAIVAANISTMDSQLLVCATILSEDLIPKLSSKKLNDKTLVMISRLSLVVVSLVALSLSFTGSKSIQDTVFYSWCGLGCSFGPLVLSSLYIKKLRRYGAYAGLFIGGFLCLIWEHIPGHQLIAKDPMIPAFTLSFISIWLVSKIKRQSPGCHC